MTRLARHHSDLLARYGEQKAPKRMNGGAAVMLMLVLSLLLWAIVWWAVSAL